MTDEPDRGDSAADEQFRENRAANLVAVNLNTFWLIGVILLSFAVWDMFVDPVHWQAAFRIRLAGAVVIVATGLFQMLPGKAHWMPLMARVRLVVAVVASLSAALVLDRGYGFGVAGMVAIFLTGPYIATDTHDLLVMNAAVLSAVAVVIVFSSVSRFDAISTIVFVLLAALVSTLLGRVIEASNRRAFALERAMHREARTDTLTGLANRRAMQERGPVELKRAHRNAASVSLILGDVDHFKDVNDRFGHEAGDAVLQAIAQTLRAALRETDLLGRWGGEEFIAVLVETDARLAAEVAERMRAAVAGIPLDKARVPMTISLGVATASELTDLPTAWAMLLHDADRRLYRAKREGRNRVVAEDLMPSRS